MEKSTKRFSKKAIAKNVKTTENAFKQLDKTGIYMMKKDGRIHLVYCNTQICERTFSTEQAVRQFLNTHTYEILPLMAAILTMNMIEAKKNLKTMVDNGNN